METINSEAVNMTLPLVSCIIPAYNHEKYIQEAIQSVITQTYKNIELVVIDDGSSDSTWKKLLELREECEHRFIRTVFIHQENQGVSKTLYKLCTIAQGEFISSCASDDKFCKNTSIEQMAEFLINHKDYGLAVGNNKFIDKDSNTCYWDKNLNICYDKNKSLYYSFVDFLKTYASFDDILFGTYKSLYISNYIPNGFTFSKKIFSYIEPLTDKSPLEDWFLMLQLSKFTKFKYINEILYSYRCHEHNTVKNTIYMHNIEKQTRNYEEEILTKILEHPPLPLRPDVVEVAKYGILLKKIGIPNIFEIQTFKKGAYRVKHLIIFSKDIFSWKKL